MLAKKDEIFCGFAGGWFNSIAFKHMQEVQVPLLDAYHITLPMWQMPHEGQGLLPLLLARGV